MSWKKRLFQSLIRRVARRQGFLDPVKLLTKLRGFAQPSEVDEPLELLRAGAIFHARGLINSRVIQHNLDWVWPYWIERQFDPRDESFIPRAFSITQINLTHRNWTAIGYPNCEELPIVDPRGLLTPFFDGWSLDAWLLAEDGRCLLPSRSDDCRQRQDMDPGVRITTDTKMPGLALTSIASVKLESGVPVCKLQLQANTSSNAWLVLALRPQNPEGISFIHKVNLSAKRKSWTVDGKHRVKFSMPAERHRVCDYGKGDVYTYLNDLDDQTEGRCESGMLTAAALFPVKADETANLTATIPLTISGPGEFTTDAWEAAQRDSCKLVCPDPHYESLYAAAVNSLILFSPRDVYAGPFTYKRFWFRDAAFIINALLCAGLPDRAERVLASFPGRQTSAGYFRSQDGEWDSNGQVLWILQRYFALTGQNPSPDWIDPIRRGARWIMRKRLGDKLDAPHAGLLPAGFSAEHLGPNDYYYWDDFWGIAGLRAAANMIKKESAGDSADFNRAADNFSTTVDRSLAACAQRLGRPAMPASPYRRMDAGAIGSLAFGYPTQLCDPNDPRLLDSVKFLLNSCFVNGAFYQDMIHSGLNAYLTLHVAQIMLRADDPRHIDLMDTIANLASPTGHWPEAVHPRTGGGCMGDGHHGWAAAEWVMMIRNCFVREEDEYLILCAGIPERWLKQNRPISFGPAPTEFGKLKLTISPSNDQSVKIDWQGTWHQHAPPLEIRLPGFPLTRVAAADGSVILHKESKSAT
jgi:hypothetical protein